MVVAGSGTGDTVKSDSAGSGQGRLNGVCGRRPRRDRRIGRRHDGLGRVGGWRVGRGRLNGDCGRRLRRDRRIGRRHDGLWRVGGWRVGRGRLDDVGGWRLRRDRRWFGRRWIGRRWRVGRRRVGRWIGRRCILTEIGRRQIDDRGRRVGGRVIRGCVRRHDRARGEHKGEDRCDGDEPEDAECHGCSIVLHDRAAGKLSRRRDLEFKIRRAEPVRCPRHRRPECVARCVRRLVRITSLRRSQGRALPPRPPRASLGSTDQLRSRIGGKLPSKERRPPTDGRTRRSAAVTGCPGLGCFRPPRRYASTLRTKGGRSSRHTSPR